MRADISTERNSRLAVTGLTVSLFIGSQVLARLSTGSPTLAESCLSGLVAAGLLLAVRNVVDRAPDPSAINRAFTFGSLSLSARRARKPLLVVASLMFALIPRVELGSSAVFGLPLRIALGVLIALVMERQSTRWLLGISMLTIVLHRWVHPTIITITFIGLILIGFAFCTRNDMVDGQNRTWPTFHGLDPVAGPAPAIDPVSPDRFGHAHGAGVGGRGIRPVGGSRYPLIVFSAIAIALTGSLLLSAQAQRLAWQPSGQGGLGGGLAGLQGQSVPQQRFTSLSANDQLDLSYRPTRSTQEVMTLFTSQPTPVFLRAQTFDVWTGQTWKNGRIVPFERQVQAGQWLVRPPFRDALIAYVNRLRAQTKIGSDVPASTAERVVIQAKVKFSGYTPVPIEPIALITDDEIPLGRWRSDGTVTPTNGKGPGIYVVLHEPLTDGQVDGARTDLLVTTGVSARVKALAASITRDKATDAAKVEAIRNWVTTNIKYDLAAKKPANGVDQIEHILFDAKAGSCTHFATVTAALLRSAGVPARVATGFVGQTRVLPDQIQVQSKDAHAWAEIPQIGGHWAILDTTLGSIEVPPRRNSANVWLIPLLLMASVAFALLALRRRQVRTTPLSPDQRLWTEVLAIAALLGYRPAAPLSYCRFTAELDHSMALQGQLANIGVALDRRSFGPGHDEPKPHEQDATMAVLRNARLRAEEILRERKAAARAERNRARSRLRARRRLRHR